MQREEALHYKALAFEKATAIESDGAERGEAHKELEEIQTQYARNEYDLYKAESMLKPRFKDLYDSLRRDIKWIVRIEADVVAAIVDAVNRGVYLEGRKVEVIAL
ncbi:uncharacterized protein N7479_000913 [Penicillium vulpinum]|uniref:uncharacterized protein n=1 Tax=Penicillium vulpinum TaxID=29845 RepID=UPI0025478456|nr:uncharacterized protein N7479_000913 [Penicillium vulpinum]KAJ5970995.1 hypothetical protein N7479_000913 [Penicillium vulpinum]